MIFTDAELRMLRTAAPPSVCMCRRCVGERKSILRQLKALCLRRGWGRNPPPLVADRMRALAAATLGALEAQHRPSNNHPWRKKA